MLKKIVLGPVMIYLVLTALTGIIYPLAVTLFAGRAFPFQARGSIVYSGNVPIGSSLIAQAGDSVHFMPRPSAGGYSTVPSGASNLGPTSRALQKAISERAVYWGKSVNEIPADLLFSSGSGLDPHISPEAALFQLERIARVRGFTAGQKSDLAKKIAARTEKLQWGMFGRERVNVLLLNCYLDGIPIEKSQNGT
jgi:K+-transporting ATPase ATPase C chain